MRERRARLRELDLQRRAGGRRAVREAQLARQLHRPRADAAAGGAHGDPGERAGVARGAGAQVGQLGVERVAGAGGRVAVAVAADALERHRRARRVAVDRPAGRGDHDLALGRDAVQRELPPDQARERLHARLRIAHRGERPDRRDPGRDGVVALRLRADHRLVDAAGAALEHLAVLVDEEVVTDVVPAVGVAVVAGDAEHDARRLLRPVGVRAHRVVDERGLHLAVERRRARRDRVAAPLAAGDDQRRDLGAAGADLGAGARLAAGAAGDVAGGAGDRLGADEAGLQALGGAAEPELEDVGGAGVGGLGAGGGVAAVGGVVAGRVEREPRRPRAAAACGRGPAPRASRRASSAAPSGRSAAARGGRRSCASRRRHGRRPRGSRARTARCPRRTRSGVGAPRRRQRRRRGRGPPCG